MKNPYLKTELKYFLHTFKRQPLLIKKAKNSCVWDEKGKKYYDFYSGLAVCGVGHTHKNVVKSIQRQSQALLHTSNFFYTPPQMALAKSLTSRYKGSRVFFSNSGAEANELAIKLARLWATDKKKKGRKILTFHGAFHGRTLATAAASRGWNSQPFGPLPKGFQSVPYNDLSKVKKVLNNQFIGVLFEPVQGEGGIHIASRSFLKGLAQLCRQRQVLLMADEIQSGLGRTGTFFAFEQAGLKPDIVTLAKGLAGGLPLGATLAQAPVARLMKPGLHGSTFGGNPVSCAASLEVLKLLTPSALRSIRQSGSYIKDKLQRFLAYPSVHSIRGLGLMVAIQLSQPGDPYVSLARERGLLINCTQGTVLRFLPPYFMTKPEIDRCLTLLDSVFKTLNEKGPFHA